MRRSTAVAGLQRSLRNTSCSVRFRPMQQMTTSQFFRFLGPMVLAALVPFAAATQARAYTLSVGQTTAAPGSPAYVNVYLDPAGSPVAAIAFAVEFDATRLRFDPSGKAGGQMDNVVLELPDGFSGSSVFLAESGRIGMSIYDAVAPVTSVTQKRLVGRLRFDVLTDATGTAPVRISTNPQPSAADPLGNALDFSGVSQNGGVTVVRGRPLLRVTPAELSFGTLPRATRSERVVIISNDGNAAVQLGSVSLAAGSDPTFTISQAPATPLELNPGASRAVTVSFASEANGEYRAELVVEAAGSTRIIVPLSATVSENGFTFESRWIIPAVAHLPGAGGSSWKSTVSLFNSGTIPARFKATLVQPGGAAPEETQPIDVEPYKTIRLDDALAGFFGPTARSGFLVVESSSPDLVVRSETANVADGVARSQAVPVLSSAQLFRNGEKAHLIDLRRNASGRSNVAVLNLSATESTLRVTLRRKEGTTAGERVYVLPAMSVVQGIDLFDALGVTDAEGLAATVECVTTDCRFFTYASTVDAHGFPSFQSPR
jgi:hypothetical protein